MDWRRALGISSRPHDKRSHPRGLREAFTVLTVAALVYGAAGSANADTIGIDFEPPLYHVGSVQDQPVPPPEGWGGQTPPGIPINPAIDQAVVTGGGRPSSFGTQSWRISNFYTSGSFGDMPFSPSLLNEAGETMAQNLVYSDGDRQNQFDAKWSFASADPTGPERDSYISTSPDRGDGARMSYIRLEDHPGGIQVWFSDYQDNAPRGQPNMGPLAAQQGCGDEDEFTDILVATVSRSQAHSVRLLIGFLDGPHNDVVKVYVDGTLRHTGTTWEDYYRWCTESGGGTGTPADQSRTVDSLLFRVGGAQGINHVDNLGKGFFIDNMLYTSSTSVHDCGNHRGQGQGNSNDKKFKFNKECNNPDRDMAEHDDEGQGHHFQSSSVDYAEFESVGGGWQMTMVGSGVDNGEPVTFTIVALDAGALLPGTYSIVLSNGYSWAGNIPVGSIDIE